ncbi:anti-sigma factor family protein [Marinobacter nitratireducens]|nr:zf-HC2 domain-containing protein [Marinobacter nitratireducens]
MTLTEVTAMNCNEFNQCLDDYAAGELPEPIERQMQQHADNCATCSQDLDAARFVADTIAVSRPPQPSVDFEAKALSGIRDKQPRPERSWTTPIWGGAVAAALVVGLFVGSEFKQQPSVTTETDTPVAEAPVEITQQVVRLAFSSNEALEDVTLTLELPANMELAPFPGHHKVSWKVDLKPGDNLLALPLNILFPGQGTLVAHLGEGSNRKTFRTEIGKQAKEPSS